jgi:hypothetical protein
MSEHGVEALVPEGGVELLLVELTQREPDVIKRPRDVVLAADDAREKVGCVRLGGLGERVDHEPENSVRRMKRKAQILKRRFIF